MAKKLKITGLFQAEIVDVFSPSDYNGAFDPCENAASNTGGRLRYRPLCGGISASHVDVLAGTLGGIFSDAITGEPLLLGNNHVFANCSSIRKARAAVGDSILQPSPADGGTYPSDEVATLLRWIPYNDTGIGYSTVDAAVARPLPGMVTTDLILSGGDGDEFRYPEGMIPAKAGMQVKKYGRTGGVTHGTIMDTNFSTIVPYPVDNLEIPYQDCILVKIDTCAGDSGALYVTDDDNDKIVGLHFGGTIMEDGTRYAIACKIQNVCQQLGIVPS
jgi:hypothetical protein